MNRSDELKQETLKHLSGMRVRLEERVNGEWVHRNSGFMMGKFEVGERVAVGSITSRDFWWTDPIANDAQRPTRHWQLQFRTETSFFRIIPMDPEDRIRRGSQ